MRTLLALALLLMTACQGSEVPQELVASNETSDVVGGVNVPYTNELTHMTLSLKIAEKSANNKMLFFQCGASALTSRVVLTAAHCIASRAEYSQIELHSSDGTITPIKAIRAYVHANYPRDSQSDLAMMELAEDLPSGVLKLAPPWTFSSLNFSAIVASGYGRKTGVQGQNGEIGVLRAAILSVKDYRESSKVFHVDQTQGKGICQGDSGSPAIIKKDKTPYIVGVVSKTKFFYPKNKPVDQCNFQGEYINLQYPAFRMWIYQMTKRLKANLSIPDVMAKTIHLKN